MGSDVDLVPQHTHPHLPTDGPLSEGDARHLTEMIRTTTDLLWHLLDRAHRGRAWKPLGYASFEAYVREEFNLSRSRAYQLLNQARVIAAVAEAVPDGTAVTITEAAARKILPVLNEVTDRIRKDTVDVDPHDAAVIVADIVDDTRQSLADTADTADTPSASDTGLTVGDTDAAGPRRLTPPTPPPPPDDGDPLDALMGEWDVDGSSGPLGPPFPLEGPARSPLPTPPVRNVQEPAVDPVGFTAVEPDLTPTLMTDAHEPDTRVGDPIIDPMLQRRRVQSAFNLFSVLTLLTEMPDPSDVIGLIPPERALQVSKLLPDAQHWLDTFTRQWHDRSE